MKKLYTCTHENGYIVHTVSEVEWRMCMQRHSVTFICCSGVSMERDLPVIMNLITSDSSAFTTLPPSVHYLRERETASCRERGRN